MVNHIHHWKKDEIVESFVDSALSRLWRMAHELDCGDLETAQETIHLIEEEAWYLWKLQNTHRDKKDVESLYEMQKWLEKNNG